MSEAEIRVIVDKLGDLVRVLASADPNDKSEIFRQLGLRPTYHPGRRIVEAKIEPVPHGFFESVRGLSTPKSQGAALLSCEFVLEGGVR